MVNNPRTHAINYPDPQSGPWLIKIHVAPVAGRMECVGVEVLAYNYDPNNRRLFLPDLPGPDDPTPIHAAPFREIPLGRLVKQTLDTLVAFGPQLRAAAEAAGLSDDYLEHQQDQLDAAASGRAGRGGRKGVRGPDHYKKVADVYAKAWGDGLNPTQAVADHWTVAKSTAAKWVSRARRDPYNFLEPTTRGRHGGVPTDHGEEE